MSDAGDDVGKAMADAAAYVERAKRYEKHLFIALTEMYRTHPAFVAELCDEHLDKSGKLLGRIREETKKATIA